MSKKILIFSLAYYPFMGGAEQATKEITDRIGDDFSFDMITLRFDRRLPRVERVGNVTVHRIGFTKNAPTFKDLRSFPLHINKLLFQIVAPLMAIKLHKEHHYDAVWAMMAHSTAVPVALFNVFYPRVPYMLTLQEGDDIAHIKRMMAPFYPLFKRAFTHASVMQVISTYLGRWAREMGFKGNLVVVPNGVDIEKFSAEGGSASGGKIQKSKIKNAELKQDLGIRKDEKIIITTSRLVPKNALDDVIKSLKYLSADIKFLILGTGPDEDMLRTLAEREGVSGRVFFIGHIPYEKIPPYLWMSDIFARPSLSEGMGSSFVEAMAAGVPILGTPVGGIPDFLKDEETGFFCAVRDPKSIAQKIRYILEPKNKEHIARIIQNGERMARMNHDWDKNAQKMKQLFQEII